LIYFEGSRQCPLESNPKCTPVQSGFLDLEACLDCECRSQVPLPGRVETTTVPAFSGLFGAAKVPVAVGALACIISGLCS